MSSLRTALQRIHDEHGHLTPSLVVHAARAETHPLHSRFEWDDSIAGEKYRQHQAGQLIRSVKIRYAVDDDGQEKTVREWISVHSPADDSDDEPERSYRRTGEVLEDPFTRRLVLAEFEREWKAFRARYHHLAEFADTIRRDVQDAVA